MPADAATAPVAFVTAPLPLEAVCDGGLLQLAEADAALGRCAALAACVPEWRRGGVRHWLLLPMEWRVSRVPEWRRGGVRHSRETLVRPRVLQLDCGYADQDDADTLGTSTAASPR